MTAITGTASPSLFSQSLSSCMGEEGDEDESEAVEAVTHEDEEGAPEELPEVDDLLPLLLLTRSRGLPSCVLFPLFCGGGGGGGGCGGRGGDHEVR